MSALLVTENENNEQNVMVNADCNSISTEDVLHLPFDVHEEVVEIPEGVEEEGEEKCSTHEPVSI